MADDAILVLVRGNAEISDKLMPKLETKNTPTLGPVAAKSNREVTCGRTNIRQYRAI